jgi:hypothetical protein
MGLSRRLVGTETAGAIAVAALPVLADQGQRMRRIVVTVCWPFVLPVVGLMWLGLGLLSMRALGRALEETGRNLQRYHW